MNDNVDTPEVEETAAVQEELPKDEGPKMRKKVTGITNEAALELLIDHNPKREGSKAHKVFQIYLETKPKTVQEAIDNGIGKDHVAYDFMHGSISVAGAEVVEYEVTPRGPRADAAAEDVAEPEVAEGDDGF